jgi:ubiquitin-like protein Pup
VAERVQKQKPAPQERTSEEAVEPKSEQSDLVAKTDELLDEIDDLLDDILGEESAQDFVASYRQKGGE